MRTKGKIIVSYIILSLILAAVFLLALSLGSVSLSLKDIIEGFSGKNEIANIILNSIRLPRILASALAGAALASSGAILQSVTSNELSAPNIIGINSGAGFGVMLMLCFAPSLWQLIPVAAFAGALITTALIMGIAFIGNRKTKGTAIILCGVALSSLLNAGISFLSLRFPDILSSYTAFSVGGFSGIGYNDIYIPAIIILITLIISQIFSPKINMLCLGDEIASSIGINVAALRIISLICAAALSASAVSFAGLLGFAGLIVPHIVRRVFGNDMRLNLSFCALTGAILVVLSDLLGRLLFSPSELPCGIIMSIIGAPFFLYLLISRRYKNDAM